MAPPKHSVRNVEGNEFWTEIGLDYGTSSIKVCYTVLQDGKQIQKPKILPLQGDYQVSSAVAWYGTPPQFYWGNSLREKVYNGEIPAESVIEHAKLALYDGLAVPGISNLRDRVTERLNGHTIEEMLETHFKHIVAEIKKSLRDSPYQQILARDGPDFLATIPMRARCTVPHSFGPLAGFKLQAAAKKGGFSRVELASEQLCALAAYIDGDPDGASLKFFEGDSFILVDAGCGTVDSVLFKQSGQGTGTNWEAVDQSAGSVFGSQSVNEHILEALRDQIETNSSNGLAGEYTRLNVSSGEFTFRLLSDIEQAKRQWKCHPRMTDDTLTWQNSVAGHSNGVWSTCAFRISHGMIRNALDFVIDKNMENIKQMAETNPKFIVLAGGFGQCRYLRDRFQAKYEISGPNFIKVIFLAKETDEATIVARGALSPRYSTIDTQRLPSRYGYAALQDEPYDKDRHPDCLVEYGDGQTRRNHKKTKKAKVDGQVGLTVIDRLRFIRRIGQVASQMTPYRLVFQPTVEDRVVSLHFVCTEDKTLRDGSPGLADNHDASRADNKLHPSVHEWTAGYWKIDEEIMVEGGWKKVRGDHGKLCYEDVYAEFSIRCHDEKNMEVKMEVLLPADDLVASPVHDKDGVLQAPVHLPRATCDDSNRRQVGGYLVLWEAESSGLRADPLNIGQHALQSEDGSTDS